MIVLLTLVHKWVGKMEQWMITQIPEQLQQFLGN